MNDGEKLDELARALYDCSFARLEPKTRLAVLQIAVDIKRNDILSDIVTTLDRIQNDTDSIAKTLWDK